MTEANQPESLRGLFVAHERAFEENRYVYPVVSRRARGVSIGVNLNLDKVCNFDCVYCQVNRSEQSNREFVGLDRLAAELDGMVCRVVSGRLFEEPKFAGTPEALRRLNDIALSGDGEPTTYRNFDDVAAVCAEVRRRHGLDDLKLVLITNATMFHRPHVRHGLEILDGSGGEIWAKLDAGTEGYYRQVDRAAIPFHRILENLTWAAQTRPIVIQSLFMRLHGKPPSDAEREAYCQRLNDILAARGRIKLVQVHTVARPPAESWVTALSNTEVDALVDLIRLRTGLPVEGHYGS